MDLFTILLIVFVLAGLAGIVFLVRQRSIPGRDVPLERHERPFTKSGGMVAPKFGSAGSGGAEYEPGPERHRDDTGGRP